ncbi:Metallo-dependent hydrolase [Lentinula guzmanii]|uniref:Metallo-dependent hydrolase n=1 Tax=Lentinula guzmanii TaxID=2804957 RepID=A0AA38J734_9AGAR|nr:Metallo-dependent hydrolase [Lentinula guzmanii]
MIPHSQPHSQPQPQPDPHRYHYHSYHPKPGTPPISGPSLAALNTLTEEEVEFILGLPKAELHAHLNGCVGMEVLFELADEFVEGIGFEQVPPNSNDIGEFFKVFGVIYGLVSTREALGRVTRGVLGGFIGRECEYLELRTTPRRLGRSSLEEYLETVLDEVERYPKEKAGLIVSVDRRMPVATESESESEEGITVEEVVNLAIEMKKQGRRVVGVDVCGDPRSGDMELLKPFMGKVREVGLGLTVHIAEIPGSVSGDTQHLLSFTPDRIGHGTFLSEKEKEIVLERRIPVEVCLSSNIICKTVPDLASHHIRYYLERDHPIVLCTDDTLPFRTSLTAEYALLLAKPPFGLGLSREEVRRVAEWSLEYIFVPAFILSDLFI